jgi:hypothetical protein
MRLGLLMNIKSDKIKKIVREGYARAVFTKKIMLFCKFLL